MLFTLLSNSPFIKCEAHKRDIIIMVCGFVLYSVIHWILFSSIGDANPMIKKYRNAFYLIVLSDVAVMAYQTRQTPVTNKLVCENDVCIVKKQPEQRIQEKPIKEEQPSEQSKCTIPIYQTTNDEISVYKSDQPTVLINKDETPAEQTPPVEPIQESDEKETEK